MKEESIGALRYGMTEVEVKDLLGVPTRRSRRIEEGATGDHVEGWTFAEGISLGMRSDTATGPLTVRSIAVEKPSTLRSKRDVGIGSTRSDVLERYAADVDRASTNAEVVVIGSFYGGVLFRTRGGVVREIFVGAVSE